MKRTGLVAAALMLAVASAFAETDGRLIGDYVEARTAEVFTGGCIMGSEAETTGRQAVMAWRVTEGSFNGVTLDGLAVVAAIAGDRNLGIREIGGTAPSEVKAALLVDARATAAQRDALVAMVRELSRGLADRIVDVRSVAIDFARDAHAYRVTAGDTELAVETAIGHSPSCGAMQWFTPLSKNTQSAIGMTKLQVFADGTLGTKWQQRDKRSAFFGTFSY